MTSDSVIIGRHPEPDELAAFLAGGVDVKHRRKMEEHLASCDSCFNGFVASYEAVNAFNKAGRQRKKEDTLTGKINIYLVLAAAAFTLSFVMPRFFIQLLTATLLFGIKWIADSRSARMLVMIYEAWKKNGPEGASDILATMDRDGRNRFYKDGNAIMGGGDTYGKGRSEAGRNEDT